MEEILLKLKKLNVQLKVVDKDLKVMVPDDFDDPLVIYELNDYKEELVSYLITRKALDISTHTIPKADDKENYPLTPAQLRLFMINQLNNKSLAFNQLGVFKIEGTLDSQRLSQTFEFLIERHASFRTGFYIYMDNSPVQKIISDCFFEIENFKGTVEDIPSIIKNFIKPFELDNPPLIRAGLLQVTAKEHYIFVDMHQIISDRTSLQIFMKEFTQVYRGEELPSINIQYIDYSEWYLSYEHQNSLKNQKEFWVEKFNGINEVLELPYDFPRPREKSFKGKVINFTISKNETTAIKNICEEHDITLFSVLLGFYGILLSKLSGKPDIIIGTLMAGRKHTDVQDIVGMFANTLALPIHIRNNASTLSYLKELHKTVLHCFDNDKYSYEDLINSLRIESDPGRNPLFDCLFVLQHIDKESFEIENAKFSENDFKSNTSKFDISLEATEVYDEIHFSLNYSSDIFTASTILKFIKFYKALLEQVINDNSIDVSDLTLLTNTDQNALIQLNNIFDISYPQLTTVVGLFESQATKTPDSIAVVYQGDSLTYSELNNQSNILASDLRSRGIGRDDIIGLLLDKNLHTLVGMLGILKSGGCYLPIDPTYPESRIQYMIEDSGLALVVTDLDHESIFDDGLSKLLIEDVLKKREVSNLPQINHPEDLCYIIYTSGTTGNPKGVMVTHENVVRLFYNDEFKFSFGSSDVWTMFHSHCFDFSVWEMYGALLYGGKVVVVSPADARDPSQFVALLKEHKVTILNQTPSYFNNLIEEIDQNGIDIPDLRYVIFGGEALIPLKLKSWKEHHPEVILVNMYGITEVTVHATYKEIGAQEIEANISNLGKPIPTTSIYVLDAYQNLVPQGVIGEIYVGGAGISRGYLNRKDLTDHRFMNNPYNQGDRMYRSGDLGRLLENGDLEYCGRIDDQVQLRGFRIELKEIEHHLFQHNSIQNALVVLRHANDGHPYLCAYYMGVSPIEISTLRTYLTTYLPNYMIPSYFVHMDSFPVTANNKIALTELPSPR